MCHRSKVTVHQPARVWFDRLYTCKCMYGVYACTHVYMHVAHLSHHHAIVWPSGMCHFSSLLMSACEYHPHVVVFFLRSRLVKIRCCILTKSSWCVYVYMCHTRVYGRVLIYRTQNKTPNEPYTYIAAHTQNLQRLPRSSYPSHKLICSFFWGVALKKVLLPVAFFEIQGEIPFVTVFPHLVQPGRDIQSAALLLLTHSSEFGLFRSHGKLTRVWLVIIVLLGCLLVLFAKAAS